MTRFALFCAAAVCLVASSVSAQETPRASNPHGDIQLDCRLCHGEGSWRPTAAMDEFDHSTTGFALAGRHADAGCRDCHLDPRFSFVGTACADCHDDAHDGRLGPDCDRCHEPTRWVDRNEQRRAHDATSFPLVGAHERVDCDACHTGALGSDFLGTPTDCFHCHGEVWAATTDPDHQAAGFGTDCSNCHSLYASTWGSGDFIHPGSFPLTGAHRTLACVECHADGFGGAPADCFACHQGDYDATNDPDHLAAGFPTGCASCHTTTAWEPSTWDHDGSFPIYSGRHRDEWNSCADCHTVASDYGVFECIYCHEHNQSDTDRDHSEVRDYRFLSTACLECHPDGSN